MDGETAYLGCLPVWYMRYNDNRCSELQHWRRIHANVFPASFANTNYYNSYIIVAPVSKFAKQVDLPTKINSNVV